MDAWLLRRRDRRSPDDSVRAQALDGGAFDDGLRLDRPARANSRGRPDPHRGVDRRRRRPPYDYVPAEALPGHRVSVAVNLDRPALPTAKGPTSTEGAVERRRRPGGSHAVDFTIEALRLAGILRRDDRIDVAHVEAI